MPKTLLMNTRFLLCCFLFDQEHTLQNFNNTEPYSYGTTSDNNNRRNNIIKQDVRKSTASGSPIRKHHGDRRREHPALCRGQTNNDRPKQPRNKSLRRSTDATVGPHRSMSTRTLLFEGIFGFGQNVRPKISFGGSFLEDRRPKDGCRPIVFVSALPGSLVWYPGNTRGRARHSRKNSKTRSRGIRQWLHLLASGQLNQL